MKTNDVKILAVDTSCDETSAAVLINDRVVSNVIASQVELHRKWGGVVPMIAKRAHQENIDSTIAEALKLAQLSVSDLDAVAVTYGPGLAIALEVGLQKVKQLAVEYHKPLVAVNHMEGHLLSPIAKNASGTNWLTKKDVEPQFPALGFLVSGGHTEIILVNSIGVYQKIGQTVDDAAGESFDKFAKMLNLGYPGGPLIEDIAKQGNSQKYELPRPMSKSQDYNYSFSGLKTAALYLIRDLKKEHNDRLSKQMISDLSASFQKAVIDSLLIKLEKAVNTYQPKMILAGGGVMANVSLRSSLRSLSKEHQIPIYFPYSTKKLTTDNAGMIGVAAYYKFLRNEFVSDITKLDRNPSLSI